MPKFTRKEPKKPSERYLENAALYYLQRYAASSENLRRVLSRRVKRGCTFHEMPEEPFLDFIEKLIVRYQASGLLNDQGFAEAKASSLRRQGKSASAIKMKLQQSGIGSDMVMHAIERVDDENGHGEDSEFEAALRLARKKRLGPFRTQPVTGKDPAVVARRDLSALARAGFNLDIAKRVLNLEVEDIETDQD